jgi:SpoVK/Ycf46/Vps4 family AAA+-type ATPase
MATTSFQSLLERRSVSLAKSLSHSEVLIAHVLVVIAESAETIDQASVAAYRQTLPKRGNFYKTPAISEGAANLIKTCPEAEDCAKVLTDNPPAAPSIKEQTGSVLVAEETETEDEPETAAESALPAGKKASQNSRTVIEILAELDQLTGLGNVKKQLRKVVAVVEANRVRQENSEKAVAQSLHLVFTGNPGTGKTTVARLVAEMYGATGAIKGTKFRETTRADLVARYVGHTAQQTTQVVNSVRPGVLFIDEAYSLNPSHNGDFAEEAIATLVKQMEDYRSELAVIVAGYSAPMDEFVRSNPGLRSRFQTFIHFDDYTDGELVEIYCQFAKEAAIDLADGVTELVSTSIHTARAKEDFGNARFARSLWEQTYANMAMRAHQDGVVSPDELKRVELTDVPKPDGNDREVKRKIGFAKRGE